MRRKMAMDALTLTFVLLIASNSGNGASLGAALETPLSSLLKWSSKSLPKNPQIDGIAVQFESGYLVETIAEGNRLGMTPHAIRVSPEGELIAVDSINSNIVRITPPLSAYSRGRLVAGSFQGRSGLVDGKPSDARFHNPRGVAMDGKGNIFVADVSNLAIRKIGDSGVSTIAGGKANAAGFRDGPSEEARFSADFDIIYVKSICSLVVVDRGNAALRKIFLHDDDCVQEFSSINVSDILLVIGAVVAGYLSCLIQHGLVNKKFATFEKLKEEPEAVLAFCRQFFAALRGACSGKTKMKRAQAPAQLVKAKNTVASDLKQQKSAKAALVRDYLAGSAKHRRRQEFDEFYGAAVGSGDRKFDHHFLMSRAKLRQGQRGD
ncbi:uncharacterized protein LOC144703009 [Wolffia australiana]